MVRDLEDWMDGAELRCDGARVGAREVEDGVRCWGRSGEILGAEEQGADGGAGAVGADQEARGAGAAVGEGGCDRRGGGVGVVEDEGGERLVVLHASVVRTRTIKKIARTPPQSTHLNPQPLPQQPPHPPPTNPSRHRALHIQQHLPRQPITLHEPALPLKPMPRINVDLVQSVAQMRREHGGQEFPAPVQRHGPLARGVGAGVSLEDAGGDAGGAEALGEEEGGGAWEVLGVGNELEGLRDACLWFCSWRRRGSTYPRR